MKIKNTFFPENILKSLRNLLLCNIYIKKRNVSLNKKGIFIFYSIFKLSRHISFPVLPTDVCFLFSYFCCSLTPVSKTQGIQRIFILRLYI